MPTDTPTDERGIDRANDDLDRRVHDELERRLENNYGDEIGGTTRNMARGVDESPRSVAWALRRLSQRPDDDLEPGDICVERRDRSGNNRWRVTRVEGGDLDGE